MAIRERDQHDRGEHHGQLDDIPGEALIDSEPTPNSKLRAVMEGIINNEEHARHAFLNKILAKKGYVLHVSSTDMGKIVRYGTMAALGTAATVGIGVLIWKSRNGEITYKTKDEIEPQNSYLNTLKHKANGKDTNNSH